MPAQNIHQATFSGPQGPMNPLGVKIEAPVLIEVFQPDGGKKWQVREATTRRVIKHAGNHLTPVAARTAAAVLFQEQREPWTVNGQPDPTARLAHLHMTAEAPSLCGSRYHLTINPALALVLPDIRRGAAKVPDAPKVCPNCCATFDRTPQPGDKVGKLSGEIGYVVSSDRTDGAYIKWDSGECTTQRPAEVKPLFLEQFR